MSRHPDASVFHTRGWLDSLKRTYGYEPFALTTTAEGPLANGLVCCRVHTWAARRLVSLPFSDHCQPLVDREDDLAAMLSVLADEVARGPWRSFELRPRTGTGGQPFRADECPGTVRDGGRPSRIAEWQRYILHTLDLRRPPADVFKGFHASSTRRAVRRAEREGVTCEAGRTEAMLAEFYRLLRLTRRRHGLPPQPWSWFRHLAACVGDGLSVRLATWDGRAIAGMLTLTFRQTMVYKYGGSDERYHSLGGMPLLFWRAIQDAMARGIEVLDLGRSDPDQTGLLAFKDHLGAARRDLVYFTSPARTAGPRRPRPADRAVRWMAQHLPDTVLDLSGRLLYRHLG